MKGINVLSLFGGIECGRVAMDRLGWTVYNYFSAEVDLYAQEITAKNHKDIRHIGDVTKLSYKEKTGAIHFGKDGYEFIGNIDLLIGGSPCQDLSTAKANGQGLAGEKSGLFYEYVRILHETKPKYFLLENVASMKKADRDEITRIMGVEPILINSALVSAQNRKRLYWVGQNRERLYNGDILCKQCFHENNRTEKGSLGEGEETLLGETQEGQVNMQGVQYGISKDRKEVNSKNLQGGLYSDKQENEGQKLGFEKQGESFTESKRVHENGKMETMEGGIQKDGSLQGNNEKSGGETRKENNENYANSYTPNDNMTKKETNDTGGNRDFENGEKVCCVRCGKELIHRPYNGSIEGMNEGPRQFTDSLQELQFTETRQNNGRIFDRYTLGITQPKDREIFLKDILEDIPAEDPQWKPLDEKYITDPVKLLLKEKEYALTATYPVACPRDYIEKASRQLIIGQFRRTSLRVHADQEKVCTLTANMVTGGNNVPIVISEKANTILASYSQGAYPGSLGTYRERTIVGMALRNRGEGKAPEFNGTEKANSLTTVQTDSVISDGYYWRKLTPVECERLQTLPDGYTDNVSATRRYKAIGNGWTCDIIAHILSFAKFD